MIAFALGIVVGALGVILISLCVAAGEADKRMESQRMRPANISRPQHLPISPPRGSRVN